MTRVALVTGATGGIGAATARRLASAGFLVAVNHLADERAANALASEVGGVAFEADVADATAVMDMVATIEGKVGPLAAAVSNAGIYEATMLSEISDEMWHRMLRVHLGGAFHLARAVVPRMRARGSGSLVLVASELALTGSTAGAHYVAAKAAMIGFGRALARECAPTIRVNVVAPGPVDTRMLPAAERTASAIAEIPLGRLGRPDEIADAIVHVAEARWTTGALYSPNGGVVIQ